MALVRVAQYNSTPTVVGDYQAQNAHLQAFTNQLLTQQFILDSGTDQPVIKQGCYVSHGGSLYIADADTAITGSPSDGSVYIRVSGTTSLTVEFVTDISGYAWNPVYSALTSGSYTLLPYLIIKASSVWTRYNFNPNNQSFGAIKATSVDTGQGATEVHLMNQNLRTVDSPTFNTIGFTSLSPNGMTITSKTFTAKEAYVLPKGAYYISPSAWGVEVQVYNGSTWVVLFAKSNTDVSGGFVMSDGINTRLYNSYSEGGYTATIVKW